MSKHGEQCAEEMEKKLNSQLLGRSRAIAAKGKSKKCERWTMLSYACHTESSFNLRHFRLSFTVFNFNSFYALTIVVTRFIPVLRYP